MGSSHHVFFSPRAQVNLHVAQHVDVVARRAFAMVGCAMPRWRSTGRFHSNAGQLNEFAFTRSQYGFHAAVGALVLTRFVAKRRYNLLVRAR